MYISSAISNHAAACSGDTLNFPAGYLAGFLARAKSLSSLANLRSVLPRQEYRLYSPVTKLCFFEVSKRRSGWRNSTALAIPSTAG